MSLKWNGLLCTAILLIAIAFVAGVLFLAGPGGSSAPTAAGVKTPLSAKTKVLPKTLAAKTAPAPAGMQPTEANMTVIGQANGTFAYSGSGIEVDVTNPPLLVDLMVVPKTTTETKWFVNRSLTKKEEVVQVPVVSPASFANISVIEMATGRIIAREGFGRDESSDRIRAIKVYEPGRYLIQLYGNDVAVKALVSMRTPGLTF
jgi:hypothetical protein